MKQINLLPALARKKEAQQRIIPYIIIAAVVAIMTVGGGWAYWRAEASQAADDVVSLKKLEKANAAQVSKESTSNSTKDLIERINQLNTLSRSEVSWKKAFAFASALTPKDIQLASLSFVSSADSMLIKFGGEAPSNLSFANLYQSMRENKDISDLKADTYSYNPTLGTVTFSLSFKVATNKVLYVASK